MKVLITGGAGFIGSHLADALIARGHQVRLVDSLHPQVHGAKQELPAYLHRAAEFIQGDVRDHNTMRVALEGIETVFHFAAYTGVGQSMYQLSEYMDVNVGGTAILLELLSQKRSSVQRLILSSSRAVYGEGAYKCALCGIVEPLPRSSAQLEAAHWEARCPNCDREVEPIATPETKTTQPASIYAITKLNQEQSCLVVGDAYHLPVVVLRFFNVYGPRQSMQNPYTGVINTFIRTLLNGKPPPVYEDGRESRDFVHVDDVVRACLLAAEKNGIDGEIFNIGSGESLALTEVARQLAHELDGPLPVTTGQFRIGDIRHCYADITRAREKLGYEPEVSFRTGITELVSRISEQRWQDLSAVAESELVKRGLSGQ